MLGMPSAVLARVVGPEACLHVLDCFARRRALCPDVACGRRAGLRRRWCGGWAGLQRRSAASEYAYAKSAMLAMPEVMSASCKGADT